MDRGAPVPAGVSGKVKSASGNTVVIADNAGKSRMQFHHFDKISARVGESVSPNTILGAQGNTDTKAVHVHLDASAADHGRWIQGITKSFGIGGRISKPTRALIGEKGPEFIFDADTTRGLDRLAPLLLEKLNAAKTKPQLASILQSYAPYEIGAKQTVFISREMIPIPILMGDSASGGGVSRSSSVNTTYDRQYRDR
jgi:murein DD-endopeptidase MepM/ murein hydrolase activator NlpD